MAPDYLVTASKWTVRPVRCGGVASMRGFRFGQHRFAILCRFLFNHPKTHGNLRFTACKSVRGIPDK